MRHRLSFRALSVAVVFAVTVLVSPVSSAGALVPGMSAHRDSSITVTAADVTASNKKIVSAYGALVTMWTTQLHRVGVQFAPPHLARYEQNIMTRCGPIRPNNAEYCAAEQTIFFDDVFVAGMAKQAAVALGTDGDMAGIGIIAHEMGHAVALQAGAVFRDSYGNESTADCLAGAFAQQADHDGQLEKGDIEEALYGMSMAGDPTPQPTGNTRVDARVASRLARESHGTEDQRVANFKSGLAGGPGACLEIFGKRRS